MLRDNETRYGAVSRFLHWGMALLVVWQCGSSAARFFMEDSAIEQFMWPTHKPVGLLIFVFMVIRIGWAVMHMSSRPAAVNMLAKLGHIALYAFLFAVPLFALLRQYGSGRTFEAFGITVMAGFEGEKIEWMLELGNNWHGLLGWTLFAFVAGHILMAFVHRYDADKQDIIRRMWR